MPVIIMMINIYLKRHIETEKDELVYEYLSNPFHGRAHALELLYF
jgi:hypothetical protein